MGTSTLITPRDLLIPTGERVMLEVEVERRFFSFVDPPRPGVQVEVEGARTALSDESGEASIDLGVPPPGFHRLLVRAEGRSAEVRVAVVPQETPVFISDIDHTIADVSSVGFIFRSVKSVLPLDGAREALEVISRRMQLVYLSARDHIFAGKTRDWLSLHRFPEAPLYLRRRTRFWSVGPEAHKAARLGELRPRFPNLRWGIGDMPGDARAYALHGIRPILIGPRALSGLPPDTLHVSRWSEVLDHVLG